MAKMFLQQKNEKPEYFQNWPHKTIEQLATEALADIKSAVPFNTTFLFLEDGCAEVGQGSDLAKAIEVAMERRFKNWCEAWIVPKLQDIQDKA